MAAIERYLEGKHAIVTGGNQGIGAAIASELAARGANLTIMARSVDRLTQHAKVIVAQHGVQVIALGCDVTQEDSVATAFGKAIEIHGPAHVLVNNAGAAESAVFSETTRDLWDRMLAVNLTGTYACTAQVYPAMLAAKRGRIVNIASTAGMRGFKTMSGYCAAKHGVIGLTRALALEAAKHGVTVNAVCPGYTDTAIAEAGVQNVARAFDKTADEALAMLIRTIPRGKMATSTEVASAVSWLCSPHAAAVTGISFPVAGGEVW